jgi:hypothetical protein
MHLPGAETPEHASLAVSTVYQFVTDNALIDGDVRRLRRLR